MFASDLLSRCRSFAQAPGYAQKVTHGVASAQSFPHFQGWFIASTTADEMVSKLKITSTTSGATSDEKTPNKSNAEMAMAFIRIHHHPIDIRYLKHTLPAISSMPYSVKLKQPKRTSDTVNWSTNMIITPNIKNIADTIFSHIDIPPPVRRFFFISGNPSLLFRETLFPGLRNG
jgi:hypothetical protein